MKLQVMDLSLTLQEMSALSFREKLLLARRLDGCGVDGLLLPQLSGEKETAVICRTIAEALNCTAMLPCDSLDGVNAAWACLKNAKDPCIVISLPVSTVQMEYHYQKKADKMLVLIRSLCATASELCGKVLFLAKDASRAEAGFTAAACAAACESGAGAVAICDDSGVCFPQELAALVTEVAACGKKVFVCPSNAMDMAAACAVEAIRAGAAGVMTGIEGAYLRPDRLAQLLRAKGASLGVETGLDVTAIAAKLGINAPVCAPEAPAAIALDETGSLADIAAAVAALGYELSDEDVGKVFSEFRRVIRKRGNIGSLELEAIIATAAMQVPSTFHVVNYVVNCGNVMTATANITLEKNGETLAGVSMGDGPIDAAFHAIESIIGHHYELDDFQIGAVTKGREAVGNALVRLRSGGKLYSGNGISTDIIGASIRAYINALHKIVYEEK